MHPIKPHAFYLIGRNPAKTCQLISIKTNKIEQTLHAQEHHHFTGHAAFDQKFLYTTEWDYTHNIGKVGLWHLANGEFIKHLPSFGVGPHQIKIFKTHLLIANGGLKTHPSTGKKPLNLPTMAPNISLVDTSNEQLTHQWTFNETKASIRHLDIAPNGTFAAAMQVQRSACGHNHLVPLVAVGQLPNKIAAPPPTSKSEVMPTVHTSLTPLPTPDALLNQCQDYMGSICIHPPSGTVAATSPKGNLVLFWHLESATFAGYYTLFGACGIDVDPRVDSWVVSNGQGDIHYIDPYKLTAIATLNKSYPGVRFDNHLSVLKTT